MIYADFIYSITLIILVFLAILNLLIINHLLKVRRVKLEDKIKEIIKDELSSKKEE